MYKRFKVLCFIFAISIFFFAGMYTKHTWDAFQKTKLDHLMHPAMQVKMWPHELTGSFLFSRPVDKTSYLAELCLQRESEIVTISRHPNESWDSFFVASRTNYAFVLVKTKDNINGYNFARLVKITLPQQTDSLNSLIVETLFTMDELEVDKGKSWINRIEGVSVDGMKILLSRSFPLSVTAETARWEFKKVIYDAERGVFDPLVFDSNDGIFIKTK